MSIRGVQMSIYAKDGTEISNAYDLNGTPLVATYDVNGNAVFPVLPDVVPRRFLVWHDEFDGSAVDRTKWSHLFGYYNANRYYMYENDLAHNAYCENSVLHITNEKDSTMPNTQWTGAFIHTNNVFEFRYGLIEAKIKFPTNTNVYHSTFWTLGACYERICNANTQGDETKGVLASTCGEIDIAESDNGSVTTTKHWAKPSDNSHLSGGNASLTSDAGNWHIYGCEWTENDIKIYVDRVLKSTWSVSNATVEDFNAFKLPHFLMLNQNPYLSGTQTQTFLEALVDWVRVYAPNGVTGYITETAISIPSTLSISVGGRHFLESTFTPSNPSDMTLKWESSDEDVAICYGGMVTGIRAGTATVKATTKHGCVATCIVTVS